MSKRRAWLALSLAAAAVLTLAATPAGAERSRDENLEVVLNGGITPKALPRNHRAPVAVDLIGGVETADGSPIPRVNWIKLELAYRGQLFRHGLAVCPQVRLESTDNAQAMKSCGDAMVGRGHLYAEIFVPNQEPFGVHAHLLAFNGQTKAGRPAVLVHAYTSNPPVSFIIPFTIHHKTGNFRTVLVTTIRRSVGPWPHVANFQIRVARKFKFRDREHSYLTASCPAPPGFTEGFLSLARATYTFAGGAQLDTETVRSCQARRS
jgi:hypothetical protein